LGDAALYFNALTGSLPSGLISLGSLKRLFVSDNMITGTIPPFQSRAAFTMLSLEANNLTGSLPESLYDLKNLEALLVQVNSLTGTINPNIGKLGQLKDLKLTGNMFSGTLTDEIADLANLEILGMAENQFNGTLPTVFGRLNRLIIFEAQVNMLTGTIPTEYGKLEAVETFNVFANELTGSIPTELGLLKGLRDGYIGLQNNSFSGSVANVFCNTTLRPELPRPAVLAGDCEEIDCPCCTDCCEDPTGECFIRVNVFCENKIPDFVQAYPAYGANCTCSDGGYTLACENTQCEPCNADGTVCLDNYDYGLDLSEESLDNLIRCKMRYLSGPSEDTEIEFRLDTWVRTCTLAINGTGCNSCDVATCNDGFEGLRADCSNIDTSAVYDDCDPALTGGDLLQFFRPEFMQSDCPPCLFFVPQG
jgi:hypothetical protein